MTDKQFAALKRSIQRDPEFMRIRPIVIDENRVIIGGNRRYEACDALGMTEIQDDWVMDAGKMTPAQRKRFIVVDNSPPGVSGDWDRSKFSEWPKEDLEEWGLWGGQPIALDLSDESNGKSGDMIACPKCGFKWQK